MNETCANCDGELPENPPEAYGVPVCSETCSKELENKATNAMDELF